ncbi:MAG TPA: orotate phosphoribosyltransferase, partial [Dehalococcoidia bacterium]|nr:orotate phosphoribosyltransferase [Dehalococcoidia bacterium]
VSTTTAITRDDIEQLRQAMHQQCFRFGDFTLTSGLPSKYYYNGKLVTLHPRWSWLFGRLLAPSLIEAGAEAVGGMAIGAIPIAQSISLSAFAEYGYVMPTFIVRQARKEHGAKDELATSYAEGGGELLVPGRRVAIVDDVITTGGSIDRSIQAVEALGCQVVSAVALVERHERGGEALKARGYNFQRLFYTNEEGELFVDEALDRRYR